MRIDLHVHSYPRSQCSSVGPAELIEEAKKVGLDGFCLTEHQVLWDKGEIDELANEEGIKIFRGNEITTAQGDVLVFGLDKDIQGIITIKELHKEVVEAGAFSIAAHPYRGFKIFSIGQLELGIDQASRKKILKFVDAIEIRNGRVSKEENEMAEKIAEKFGLIGVAGSDAHTNDALGTWIMDFENDIKDEKELVEELKAERFTLGTLR
jgi:predicted metal-dependent phosphoesterase TrpH